MTRIILGIDPGGRNTGAVVRAGDDLLAWDLIVRPRTDRARMPGADYLRTVVRRCRRLLEQADVDPTDSAAYIVGVEGVAYWPEKHVPGKAPRDQRGLYGTAMVLGAVLLRWPNAVRVDSGRGVANLHGLFYPEPIRPPGVGDDRLRDVRAAWDHSYAAETLWLQRQRERRTL